MRGVLSLAVLALAAMFVCVGDARANWFDGCPAKASAHGAVGVTPEDAQGHRIGHGPFAHSEKAGASAFNDVDICVMVDEHGRVVGTLGFRADRHTDPLADDAVRALRDGRYTPFLRDGKAVRAVFVQTVNVYPLERRPDQAPPMPPLRDPATLSIRLARSGCFGNCPIYSVDIDGNGEVRFHGESFVALPGEHRASVPPETVRALFEKFRTARFFRLFDTYRASITDASTYVVSLSYDGHTKSVLDYVGLAEGMPDAVESLEDEIDSVAGTQRWIDYSADSLGVLKREKFDFHAHPEILSVFARHADAPTMRALIATGVPVNGREACYALSMAIKHANAGAASALAGAGVAVNCSLTALTNWMSPSKNGKHRMKD